MKALVIDDSKAIRMLLTNMLKKHGFTDIGQDEPTSVVWGMPGYVAKHGLAHKIVPLPRMSSEIAAAVNNSRK